MMLNFSEVSIIMLAFDNDLCLILIQLSLNHIELLVLNLLSQSRGAMWALFPSGSVACVLIIIDEAKLGVRVFNGIHNLCVHKWCKTCFHPLFDLHFLLFKWWFFNIIHEISERYFCLSFNSLVCWIKSWAYFLFRLSTRWFKRKFILWQRAIHWWYSWNLRFRDKVLKLFDFLL